MTDATAADVANTARMLASAGLVEGFGHVSARSGDGFLITSTRPLVTAEESAVIVVDGGKVTGGPADELPLETPLHSAIYDARDDVSAICRGHPPSVVVWGTSEEPLPLHHGLGAMTGLEVPLHGNVGLVKSPDDATAAAEALAGHAALLMLGNGCLAVGSDLLEAATRLWFLEERATVALAISKADLRPARIGAEEWGSRHGDSAAEMARAKVWFEAHFGAEGSR